MNEKNFPRVKNVIQKRTKNGQRYLLHGRDLAGKDIYVTIPIVDNDTEKDYFRKIEETKIKLNEKTLSGSFYSILNQYFAYKNFAPNTARNMRFLADFCMSLKKNKEYVNELLFSRALKISTKKTYLTRINQFFRWLQDVKGIHVQNPVKDVTLKGVSAHRTRTITDEERDRLFNKVFGLNKNLELALAVRLAYYTGARISSIYALTPDSLIGNKIYFKNIKCKKEYDYPIPLTDEETIILFKMIAKKGYLWSSSIESMKVRINTLMRKEFGKDPKGENLSIHSLRHSFATRAIQNGIPPEIVAKLLDHSSINTTLTYYARHSQEQIDDAITKIFNK